MIIYRDYEPKFLIFPVKSTFNKCASETINIRLIQAKHDRSITLQ